MEPLARLGALAATVGVAGALALGAWAVAQGALNPAQLRLAAQEQAHAALADAGYPWAQLRIDGSVGVLQGDAPDERARLALEADARRLLSSYMGVPGVFLGLDNRVRIRSRARAEAPLAFEAPSAGVSRAAPAAAPLLQGTACESAFAAALGDERIQFGVASAQLDGGARLAIRRLAAVVQRCPEWRLVIVGHADGRGDAGLNHQLARRRAAVVAAELVLQNVAVEQLETQAVVLGEPDARRAAGETARGRVVDLRLLPAGS